MENQKQVKAPEPEKEKEAKQNEIKIDDSNRHIDIRRYYIERYQNI
jgi:hypothetical protein